jgi:hypothetical protein
MEFRIGFGSAGLSDVGCSSAKLQSLPFLTAALTLSSFPHSGKKAPEFHPLQLLPHLLLSPFQTNKTFFPPENIFHTCH